MAKKNLSNSFGIVSLVLGIISIILCWMFLFGLVTGILGIIFSLKQKKIYSNGIATGGLITSIIGLALLIIIQFITFLILILELI